jgi:hypothetical protein
MVSDSSTFLREAVKEQLVAVFKIGRAHMLGAVGDYSYGFGAAV